MCRLSILLLAGALLVTPALADGIIAVPLLANDLVYDPFSDRLYASTPSSAGALGNRVVRINPYSGQIEADTFIGSEPQALAISDDGRYIYVDLDGAAAIRRYHVPTATAGLQFSLGNDPHTGPYYAEDMAVVPGNPNAVAVARRNRGFSPRHEGVAIYVEGVKLPNETAGHTGSNRIEFGSSPTRLYGYNNETTEFGYRRMTVDDNGVSVLDVTGNLISNFGVDIEYDDGRIYATSGRVIDAEGRVLIGTYPVSGLVEPDSSVGRTFFLTGSGSVRTVSAFDQQQFLLQDFLDVPGVSGTAGSLVRWGRDGLAFCTTGGQVFLIRSEIVPEPGSGVLLFGALLALTSRRVRVSARQD